MPTQKYKGEMALKLTFTITLSGRGWFRPSTVAAISGSAVSATGQITARCAAGAAAERERPPSDGNRRKELRSSSELSRYHSFVPLRLVIERVSRSQRPPWRDA